MFKTTITKRRRRAGFTLVELLMVIAIIGVLTSMAIGVMANAQNEAKASATESRILQIESLLAIALEDYEVRRLPISVRELGLYYDANVFDTTGDVTITIGTTTQPKFVNIQNLRRRILADIINSEFPRPLLAGANNDVGKFPSTEPPFDAIAPYGHIGFGDFLDDMYPNPIFPGGPTLRQRLAQLTPSRVQSYGPMRATATTTDIDFDLPGEYLYAALERMDVDGTPATELVGGAAIGNSDEDGYPEVIDAWGDPLQLRIWQINATPVPADSDGDTLVDVFQDDTLIDFDDNSIPPPGYAGLNPTIPREIQKIRFEVISTRLGRHY